MAWAARPAASPVKTTFPPRSRNVEMTLDRKSTRLNSSHLVISYAVFCLKKKTHHRLSPALLAARTTTRPPLLTSATRRLAPALRPACPPRAVPRGAPGHVPRLRVELHYV